MNSSQRALGLAMLLASSSLVAQAPKEITVQWAYGDEAEAAVKLPQVVWTSGGDVLVLDERRPASERTLERVAHRRLRCVRLRALFSAGNRGEQPGARDRIDGARTKPALLRAADDTASASSW